MDTYDVTQIREQIRVRRLEIEQLKLLEKAARLEEAKAKGPDMNNRTTIIRKAILDWRGNESLANTVDLETHCFGACREAGLSPPTQTEIDAVDPMVPINRANRLAIAKRAIQEYRASPELQTFTSEDAHVSMALQDAGLPRLSKGAFDAHTGRVFIARLK